MDKEEVVLKDGTKFKFLKKNWEKLSPKQKETIVEYDSVNKEKGWTKKRKGYIISYFS